MAVSTLLITDGNEDFRLALMQALRNDFSIQCCATGQQAMSSLLAHTPDYLILDLMLPELDGLYLLEQLSVRDIRPAILVVTSLVTDYVLQSAGRLGIRYIMQKPCNVQSVVARLRDFQNASLPPSPAQTPEEILHRILHPFGIHPGIRRFSYLEAAILLLEQDPEQSITKSLYPAAAKLCSTTAGAIESGIRYAIGYGWSHCNSDLWQTHFPDCQKGPSNKAFLAHMAHELHRELE